MKDRMFSSLYLLYGVVFFSLCFFIILSCSTFFSLQRLSDLEDRLRQLSASKENGAFEREKEEEILQQIIHANPCYISEVLSSPELLQTTYQKKQFYQLQLEHKKVDVPSHFEFIEEKTTNFPLFQESSWTQKRPLFLNAEDLKHLLSYTENLVISPYTPLLIVHRSCFAPSP